MDSQPGAPVSGGDYHDTSAVLGDLRQRRVLSILLEGSVPMPLRELGVRLAAREAEIAPVDVSETDYQSIRTGLHHRCLPKLEAVGWIERYPEGIVVNEPLTVETESLSLPDLRKPEDPLWDAVSVLLAQPRRQAVVSILADYRSPVSVDELATELIDHGHAREKGYAREEQRLLTALYHADLPKLADVELIEYDAEERTVARTRRLRRVVDKTDLGAGDVSDSASG